MTVNAEIVDLMQATRRLARAAEIHSRRIDRRLGLTLPQLIVLGAIGAIGPARGRAVAAAAGLSPASLVGILDRLEAKGLITRQRSATDRRAVITAITAAGQRALDTAPPFLGAAFHEAFAALPEDGRRRMLAAVTALADMADASLARDPDARALAGTAPATGPAAERL